IIKYLKERGTIVVKKGSGAPSRSSKHQDRLLKLPQLQDLGTTSAEPAQEWQQADDVALKLIDSMPGRIAVVLKKKKGQHCKY
ncbi:DNA polymerase delta catalytic subunit, partial [Dissostichus eleginoides]